MSTPRFGPRVLSRSDLHAAGLTSWGIDREIAAGRLVRLRRDHYVVASEIEPDADCAVRIGARLACVSLLASYGAFVFDGSVLHVQAPRTASRLRAASDRGIRWSRADRRNRRVRLHWGDLRDAAPHRDRVAVADAVRTAIRCQPPRHAIATLDSVLHLRILTREALREIFTTLPPRYRVLFALLDSRSESGTESLVRLMLRQLGVPFDVQVSIDGVGRVDFVVDGWLIIECDSKAHHEGWSAQIKDRRRDLAAARRGYTTVRLLATDILATPDDVHAALADIVAVGGTGSARLPVPVGMLTR